MDGWKMEAKQTQETCCVFPSDHAIIVDKGSLQYYVLCSILQFVPVLHSTMGKAKGGKPSSKGQEAAAPKCKCEHPFNCDCGNRPPRPSRGHKWDPETQQWGGKGHKQKGGSGQTRVVGEQAQTTAVGQTQVAQWQKLPSALLREFCQKQKRPPPKFKEILQDHQKTKFKVRCIVPDAKDSDKDLFLVPANPVANEEQAQEEAALLALLQLTPSLPHERKLPEPYKTTWLTAVQASKAQQQQQQQQQSKGPSNKDGDANAKTASASAPASTHTNKATANTNLVLGTSHVSSAERRKQQEERKRERNARIRRHENIRMANRDHPVFLSAKLRQQIQRLLQGDSIGINPADDTDDGEDNENNPELLQFASDRQQYVEERLHHEGFTKRQARKAFEQMSSSTISDNNYDDEDEEKWERFYDECLQWLCVHLPEDQLPEGFDPRGQTLDVLALGKGSSNGGTTSQKKTNVSSSGNGAPATATATLEVQQLATKYGLVPADATWLLSRASSTNESVDKVLWNRIVELAEVSFDFGDQDGSTGEHISQTLDEEMEALAAMFPEGLSVEKKGRFTTIAIPIPDDLILTITLDNNSYPSLPPKSVLCSGADACWSIPGAGVGFHIELIKFLASMTFGEPMIFEIFSQVQMQQQSMDDLPSVSLSGSVEFPPPIVAVKNVAATDTTKKSSAFIKPRTAFRAMRPRERGVFWSTHPSKTTTATAFPKLSATLQMQRKSLPAGKARGDFLSILREADKGPRVVLVTGDTGCGKTTQIPQFILEEAPESAKIVVAQPRRLAATGVAARVAEERGESRPGSSSVGYVVRGDSAICKDTRLLFCTFGILLRQLQSEGALDCITHIVIDEVHERNLDGDVLMALLKQCLDTTPHLRVVLMSATLDADRFAAYWGTNTPRMHIPGRTFPVQDFFLEDVLTLTGYNPPKKRKKRFYGSGAQQQQRPRKTTPWNDSELSDREDDEEEEAPHEQVSEDKNSNSKNNEVPLEEKVKRIDESHIDYDLLGWLVKSLITENAMGSDGSILVFLPGAPEINQAKTVIGKMTADMSVLLLPLHGGLQPREQNVVFRPSSNAVKVILSTNVAETSITIPDCTVVIDGCREKQSSYDPVNRMPLLIEVFASKASQKQRRGRAGRVREGKCYKLISRETHAKLHEHTAPEITRCALDQTLLSLLFLGVETGNGTFLRTLLDPPKQGSVDAASQSLSKIGALEKVGDDELCLTPLGMHLAGIPAPPMIGKMLVMGSILGCRRAALAMAAGISTGRSPFLRVDTPRNNARGEESIQQQKDRLVLEQRSKLFELSGNSDHAMLAAAFISWEQLSAGGGERKKYCDELGLSFTGMRDILQLVNQYDLALSMAGYGRSTESDRNEKSWRVLRACAISAMAPSQLARVQRSSTKYTSTAEGAREKDGVAKELKFFIRQEDPEGTGNEKVKEERVFIHPSSALFSVGNFSCPWLVFFSMVKTSKPFLRDATECSAYALLLLGGNLDVEARNSVIIVDGWVKLSANARIGALIRGLRNKMDNLLSEKIKKPDIDISDTPEMRLIVSLLFTDGLGS